MKADGEGCGNKSTCCVGLKLIVGSLATKSRGLLVHSYHSAKLSRAIGELFPFSEDGLANIYAAGLLHDYGKTNVPDTLLYKDSQLDEHESRVMQNHAGWGAAFLTSMGVYPQVADIVRHHHELPDGSGYPDGLMLEEISLPTRIVAVAEKFSAMTLNRNYRENGKFSANEALDTLDGLIETFFNGKGAAVKEVLLSYPCQEAVKETQAPMDQFDKLLLLIKPLKQCSRCG